MTILLRRKLEEFEIWVTVAVEGIGTCTSRVQSSDQKAISLFWVQTALSNTWISSLLFLLRCIFSCQWFQLWQLVSMTCLQAWSVWQQIILSSTYCWLCEDNNHANHRRVYCLNCCCDRTDLVWSVRALFMDEVEASSGQKRTCYEDLSVLHKPAPSPWWATVWQKPLLRDLHTWFLCLSVSLSHVSRRVILRFDRRCITDHISTCRRSVEFPELCVYHRARRGKKNCLTERSSLLICTTTTVKDPCAVLQTFLQSALDLDILPLKL